VDGRPGLTGLKIGRLLVKALLFALVVDLIFSVLAALRIPYVDTIWGQLIVGLIVYIPFLRLLTNEFAAPARAVSQKGGAGRAGAAGKDKAGKKDKPSRRVHYASVTRAPKALRGSRRR
jgi:hypothetical protein